MGDVKDSFAFANGKGLLVNAAIRDLPEYVVPADGMIEEILAGLQAPFCMPPCIKFKSKRAADHPVLFEEPRHRAAGSAMRQIDEDTRVGKSLIGPLNGIPRPRRSSCGSKQSDHSNDSNDFLQVSSTLQAICRYFYSARRRGFYRTQLCRREPN